MASIDVNNTLKELCDKFFNQISDPLVDGVFTSDQIGSKVDPPPGWWQVATVREAKFTANGDSSGDNVEGTLAELILSPEVRDKVGSMGDLQCRLHNVLTHYDENNGHVLMSPIVVFAFLYCIFEESCDFEKITILPCGGEDSTQESVYFYK